MPEVIDQVRAVLDKWELDADYLCDYDAEVAAAKHCPPMHCLLLALLEEHAEAMKAYQKSCVCGHCRAISQAQAALAAFLEACR